MNFVHRDPEFPDLLKVIADARGIPVALIEKDYWVTHALWAMQDLGLEIWFKGGTSLSKGFGLIQRFSEDLDLKVEGGRMPLPSVRNWKSKERGPLSERQRFFNAIASLPLPDLELRVDPGSLGERCVNAGIEARYPGHHLAGLPPSMRPFVLLEVGDARVRPFVERRIRSWVHDHLEAQGLAGEFTANHPASVRCIHPLVTLLEKLDAISRRFQAGADPAQFIRHYEDAAHIILKVDPLPPLGQGVGELSREMHSQNQIRRIPEASDPAFLLADGPALEAVQQAFQSISPMFWGDRIPLKSAAGIIRDWIGQAL